MNDDREGLLVARLVDGCASADELRELAAAGAGDPETWERVAASLRAESTLRGAVEEIARGAERVPLPEPRRRPQALAVAAVLGWGIAATLALVVAARRPVAPAPPASIAHAALPAEPIAVLPPVLVEAAPSAAGIGFDVVFVRRTLERLSGERLFEVAHDEHGRLAPVPAARSPLDPPCSL
jgi:hypothetical protein